MNISRAFHLPPFSLRSRFWRNALILLVITSLLVGAGYFLTHRVAAASPSTTVSLSAYVNNEGIGASPGQANFDGAGYSYAASQMPSGGTVTLGGVSYVFPSASAGTKDNVAAVGQTISLPQGQYSSASFLAASSFGQTTGTVTVTYTDGSTATASLTVPDWYNNASSSVYTSSYRYTPTGTDQHAVYLFAFSVSLDATKTASTLILPNTALPANGVGSMHIFALTLLAATTSNACNSTSATATTYQPNYNSLAQYQAPTWYQDAKFGIYTHWGVYSVPALDGATDGEWFGNSMYTPGTAEWNWFQANIGNQNNGFGYKDLIPRFTASNFNPNAWMTLFKQAGAKFYADVGIHHDSFAMYNSQYTPYNAYNMGPHQDIAAELETAAHAQGLYFGITNHYAENQTIPFFNHSSPYDTTNSAYSLLYGIPNDPNFATNWYNRAKEMVDRFHPDILWFDNGIADSRLNQTRQNLAAYYYDKSIDCNVQPVLNFKGTTFQPADGVFDYERGQAGMIQPLTWVDDSSVGYNSWGYATNDTYKSADLILSHLVDVVSKNGTLMLNVGPEADGTIPPQAVSIFQSMGNWFNVDGSGIYATRPWAIYGEGPTNVTSGSFSDTTPFTPQDYRFTMDKAGTTLYIFGLAWPSNHQMLVKTLAQGAWNTSTISSVSLLGGGNLSWSQSTSGLQVNLPSTPPVGTTSSPYGVKITFTNGTIPALAPLFSPNQHYALINRATGLALDDDGAGSTNGANMIEWTNQSSTNTNQKFNIVEVGLGKYRITAVSDGLSLDNRGSSAPGDNMGQWSYNGSPNLQWNIGATDSGYYELLDQKGLALDGRGSTSPGTVVGHWGYDGSNNLQWQIVPVS